MKEYRDWVALMFEGKYGPRSNTLRAGSERGGGSTCSLDSSGDSPMDSEAVSNIISNNNYLMLSLISHNVLK